MKKNEAIKRLLDPKWYLEHFAKIKGKTPGLQPFILNEAQKDLFNSINTHSRVIILKARQIGFCGSEHTKVLLSNLKWTTLKDIKVGEKIIAVDEFPEKGMGKSRKIKEAIVEDKNIVFECAYKLTMEDGRVLELTGEHKMLAKRWESSTETVWRKARDFNINDSIRFITRVWSNNQSFEDGWFSGMIDGEGSLANKARTGTQLTISQVNGPVWERLLKYAQDNNLTYRIEIDRRVAGSSSKLGSKEVNKLVLSKTDELIELLGKLRPARFIKRKFLEGKSLPNNGWCKIIKIEKLSKRRMIDLQTSGKTYIANGFVSHNSTAITGYLYHKTITTPGTNTALIGYNSDMTAELLDKVKTFYRTTPESIRPKIQYNSKYEISFPAIDSKILVLPSSENVGRGYTLHNVLATELAFWEKAEEKMLAIENSVPQDGKIIIESTPNAIGNLYHRMFMADNDYDKKKYGWWWHYTEEEIEIIKRRINNPLRFAQEYGLEFLSSGRPVFDTILVKRLRKGILKVGAKVKNEDGTITEVVQTDDGVVKYFEPKPDGQYIVGADVAEGVLGGDYSAFSIFDKKTGHEVAFWRGYMAPEKFGAFLDKYGRIYNDALMVVEINNHGLTTVTALKNKQYKNLYFRPVTKMDTMGIKFSDRLGWKTTKMTKPLMMDDLREALADGDLIIHTEQTLDEMLTFVFNDDGLMVTQSSFHDDCFVKGTKILTNKGQINIENIKVGDLVLTREGFKPVSFTRNREKEVITNIGLRGTGSHPIILASGEQKDLRLVSEDDKLHVWNQSKLRIEKLSYIEKKDIIDTPIQKGGTFGATFGGMISGKLHQSLCIDKYGLIILEKLKKEIKYIIEMRIPLIIKFVTSSVFQPKNINLITSIKNTNYEKKPARCVAINSNVEASEKLSTVVKNAQTKHGCLKEGKEKEKVYNLQVDGCHEYFANNVLVHNCIFANAICFQGFKVCYSGKLEQIDESKHLPSNFSY